MKTTLEERKEKAVEIMNKLNIYKPYIEGFVKNNHVCYFDSYGGFWAWQDKELQAKIKEIETKYNCTVYAVTHEYWEYGECYDLLIITDYKEEWKTLIEQYSPTQIAAFAYVWNKEYEPDSEFGTILINSFGGGIRRIG